MSAPPPTYENYPPSGEDRVRSGDDAASASWSPQTVVPLGPPPPPPGPDRRGLLYLIGGGLAGVAVLAFAASGQGVISAQPSDWSSSVAEPDDDDSGDGTDNETELDGYTVSWPHGWAVDTESDTQLVLTGGRATIIFRAYTAGDDATAAEEAGRLLNRYSEGLGKRRVGDTASSSGSVEKASVEASGVRGDGVRMGVAVHVAIDADNDNEALAVISLLPSTTSTARRKEVVRMRREFLDQLG